MGKEVFIVALNDERLQLEVIKCEPQNVKAVISYAIKVETFEQLLACQGMLVDQDDS